MTRADTVIGLLGAIAYLILFWQAQSFPYGSEFAPGPGFAPVWLALIGALLSGLIAFNAWRNRRSLETPRVLDDRAALLRVVGALVGLVVMMLLFPVLGLILSVLVYLIYLTLVVQRLRWPVALGTSLGTMTFVYVVFQRFLNVPFPRGPLGI